MPCGNDGFLTDVTVTQSAVIDSTITNSTVTGSVLTNCDIQNLRSIDAASAQKILDAALAGFAPAGGIPITVASANIPTTAVGDNGKFLGEPVMFARFGAYLIPLYREGA